MQRNKLVSISAILLFCFLASPKAIGEPTPTVNWLMNEPVSMLDWGIYKMKQKLILSQYHPKSILNGAAIYIDAYYDWDRNRIVLSINSISKMDRSWLPKAWSDANTSVFAIGSSLDTEGKWFALAWAFDSYFVPQGWSKQGQPATLKKDITDILEILVRTPDFECFGHPADDEPACRPIN